MRLIDADKLLDTLGIDSLDCEKCSWGNFDYCKRGSDFVDACSAIEDAPTVDAEPVRHGHWVDNNGRYGWFCSQCKKENNYAYDYNENNVIELQDHYCPNCGARMDETVK